jgi:RHS repeat-associated protein
MCKLYLNLGFFAALLVTSAYGQVGNDNPTGISGAFDRDITTGCDYDAYTGAARRQITDLVVNGAVGAYGLSFSRTSISRYNTGAATDFGKAGSWLHSYQWTIDTVTTTLTRPKSYTVNFPDGTRLTFSDNSDGNVYGDPYSRAGVGTRERLQIIWDSQTAGRLWLILPDGGKVYFTVQRTHPNANYVFTYTLQSIIDPYGQTTTITGSPANSPVTATEPAGRWIKMYYRTITSSAEGAVNDVVIDHVTASDGRSVQYTYSAYVTPNATRYTSLVNAAYYADATLTATYTYQNDNVTADGRPLLSTCYDPMYTGAMTRIAYRYASAGINPDGSAVVSGQILSENYFDGTNVGPAVSTLSIVTRTASQNRTETTGDGRTRSLLILPLYVPIATDFKGSPVSKGLDYTYGYVNSFTDRNGNTTNWTNNLITGRPVQISYPLTPNDTPSGTPRGVITYTYGSASCADPNNRDANNPYYVCTATDEGGHVTSYTRDANKRVTQINYPDGGTESFQYNSLGQVTSHTMRTGGVETFTYDARGLLQIYRDPYHTTGNPNVWYTYDSLDRVSGITDTLGSGAGDINHTTNFTYNSRGDITVTTLPVDPNDGQRHTITKGYNLANGTVTSVTDQLNHTTSFTYDDYKRLRTTTTPPRFSGDTINHTSTVYYDANGAGEDYTRTDANVTWAVLPSGKKTNTLYDENRRKTSITVAVGTSDAATMTFGYDLNGNVTSVIAPREQPGQQFAGQSTTTAYDERDRPYSVRDPLGNVTSCTYDAAGRKASVTRANGQVITFDSYDAMNRLLQQTVKQTPDPDAVTKYTYFTSGLLATMKDPRLVATNSADSYSYAYDLMGRKTSLTYPLDSLSVHRTESWHYDTAGRIDTFTNQNGNTQRTLYDSLSRSYNVSWDDSGLTPSVTFSYDAASRVTATNNANANISHVYFDDGLLNSETTTYSDNTPRTVTYYYDADGNRAGDTNHPAIQYPNGAYAFNYAYTGRNQLSDVNNFTSGANIAHFVYDPDGNVSTQTRDNSTSSSFSYDGLDRVIYIGHALNGTIRTFDYAYDSVGNRKWVKREGGTGDVFGYDLADQSTSILLNVSNPDTTSPGSQTISYDANGNRTTFSPYGSTDTYTTNNLNQYTQRNSSNATYDTKGNMTAGFDGSTYTYDAQNRVLTASRGGTTDTFKYDGLNRQVSRQIGAGPVVYNVYDGWNLIAEYPAGSTSPSTAYLPGVKVLTSNRYYYQDASGSTSHLADNTGALLEWYRYDLQGTPTVYDPSNNQLSTPPSVRHLFTGQQWYSELGVYDLRNRFYSPDLGRFLQGDPLGFGGDATNLYRYCANNPLKLTDPSGENAIMHYPSPGNIVINLPITYNGVTASMAGYFNAAISAAWSGNYNGVNVQVNAYTPTNATAINVVNFYPGSPPGFGGYYAETYSVDGFRGQVDVYLEGLDPALLAQIIVHEAGHLMGAPDFLSTMEARNPADIMHNLSGCPTMRDLSWILENGGHTIPVGRSPNGFYTMPYGQGQLSGFVGSNFGLYTGSPLYATVLGAGLTTVGINTVPSYGYSLGWGTVQLSSGAQVTRGFAMHPFEGDSSGSSPPGGWGGLGRPVMDFPTPGQGSENKAMRKSGGG